MNDNVFWVLFLFVCVIHFVNILAFSEIESLQILLAKNHFRKCHMVNQKSHYWHSIFYWRLTQNRLRHSFRRRGTTVTWITHTDCFHFKQKATQKKSDSNMLKWRRRMFEYVMSLLTKKKTKRKIMTRHFGER